MNLKPLGANKTQLTLEKSGHDIEILFSYETPVAALVYENGNWHQYKTDKFWSRTTSRHINSWNPKGGVFGLKPQEFFDNIAKGA